MTRQTTPNQICVLWHPASVSPSSALLKVMGKRGFQIAPVSSQHLAFAGVCHFVKSSNRVVLVVENRSELDGVTRLMDALDRFAPSVICWEHDSDANPPMKPLVRSEEKVVNPSQELELSNDSVLTESDSVVSDSKLRLVGEEPAKPSVQGNKEPISARDVLDADELDALLASEVGNGRKRK
ncbi:MAG: hypothetical protein P1U42_11325 [Phycisphaerales bacterium]|nr:hypothetical protein [Phycisphaerales bacterium]